MRFTALPLIALLGGCTTADLLVPTDPRAIRTGEFPTFAPSPSAANVQLPQDEVDRATASLVDDAAAATAAPRPSGVAGRIGSIAAAGQRARDEAAPPDPAVDDLLRLRESHATDTLRRIEGN